MFRAFLADLKARRHQPTTTRRATRSRPLDVEAMEGRQLLTSLVYMDSTSTVQGRTGNATMNFTVSLMTGPSATPVTVSYQTLDGSAIAGRDYNPVGGTLTIPAGQTQIQIPVTTNPNLAAQGNLTFNMRLAAVSSDIVITPMQTGTIVEDNQIKDAKLSINGAQIMRGYGGTTQMYFDVNLNTPTDTPVTVVASTSDFTAIPGVDYIPTSQLLTFAPGQTTARFAVTVIGTSTPTPDKMFFVNLSGGSVPIDQPSAIGFIKFGA